MRFLCLLSILFFFGCSHVQRIVSNNQDIQDLALQSKDRFDTIITETQQRSPNLSEIAKEATQGILEQTEIIEKTKDTIQATTGVEDTVPWWADTIAYVMIGLSIIGIAFLLWYLGVGHLTKALFLKLGYVSSPKKDQAKLFLDAMDSNNKTTIEEAIAVLRAQDKEFNVAFKKRKEELNARIQSNQTNSG